MRGEAIDGDGPVGGRFERDREPSDTGVVIGS